MTVELDVLPHARITHIVVGTAIRKPPAIVAAYLAHLAAQDLPPNHRLTYAFVLDTADPAVRDLVTSFVQTHGGWIADSPAPDQQDFADDQDRTHLWTDSAMARVGALKNRIIQHALDVRADYLWFVDADLLCDRYTLRSLLDAKGRIVCGVYWTRWHKPYQGQVIHAAPQVWLNHPYVLHGRGWTEPEFRKALVERRLVPVYGQGACTLIRRDVLEAGVDFTRLPDLPTTGMWQGEDRHFCVKAERLHIPMLADAWPNIFHVYHPEDADQIGAWSQELLAEISGTPRLGDWVSLKLEPLELLHQGALPQWVRGRFGQIKLAPELEDAVAGLTRGDSRAVRVHFPVTYPLDPYKGQVRLIRVTLLDHKPYGFAPVVRDELYYAGTGTAVDGTVLTPDQHASIRESA